MTRLRVGTRGSKLALEQAGLAVAALRGVQVEVVTIKTEGDRDQQTPLRDVAGRGVFVTEIERALAAGEVDFAVHSLKDLPTEETPGLIIAAVLERADARDAVIANDGMFLHELAPGSRVGTSSTRRAAQLRRLYPGLQPEEIRGNVETRIRKLRARDYDAIVLAVAGLSRLGRLDEATEILSLEEMLPAPGQGAIVLQCRASDLDTLNLLRRADHAPTRAAVTAERVVLDTLGGGCSVPVAAFARAEGQRLKLSAMAASPDGATVLEHEAPGFVADPETLGQTVAARLLADGAADLLRDFAGVDP
ncbi:MAG: hydroxymethylbilane synthase [Dehalococcoidia bacterium]|nr:hydroxymethylbilane synthase [Dehalococcoidia bacterium]